jgi:hypothetical protein
MDTENLIDTDLLVDTALKDHLKETARWGKFLGIMGFVYGVLLVISAISSVLLLGNSSTYGTNRGWFAGGTIAFVYVVFAAVIFCMSAFLFRFSNKNQSALQTNDQVVLNESFKNLKMYFRIAGIVTIIALIFSVFAVIALLAIT